MHLLDIPVVESCVQSFRNWKKKKMIQIWRWSEKTWCHERRGVIHEETIGRNKTMDEEELFEKSRQGESWAHWYQKGKRPLETLTCHFQKLETSP